MLKFEYLHLWNIKLSNIICDEFGDIGDIKFESEAELAKLVVRSVNIPAEHIPLENRKTKGSFFEALIWPQFTHMYKNKDVVSVFTWEGVTVLFEDQSCPYKDCSLLSINIEINFRFPQNLSNNILFNSYQSLELIL